MSKTPFGPYCQNAFVVRDMHSAVCFWNDTMSVGPFYQFPSLTFSAGELHGRPYIPSYKAAIAYSGDLMIELIEPEGPSIFQEFLDAGGRGVHHNCVLTDDFGSAEAALIERGGSRIQALAVPDGSRLSYIEMPGDQSFVVEVAYLMPPVLQLFAAIRQAGASWDGRTRYLQL